MRKKSQRGASKAFLTALAKSRKPDAPKARTPGQSSGDSAHWAAVIEALQTKKTPPRRPRGE